LGGPHWLIFAEMLTKGKKCPPKKEDNDEKKSVRGNGFHHEDVIFAKQFCHTIFLTVLRCACFVEEIGKY